MFYFGYDHNNYKTMLQTYAKTMHTKLTADDVLIFPEAYASGYYAFKLLPNKLQAVLINYRINQDTFINRMKSSEEFYILRFEAIRTEGQMTVHFDDDYFLDSEHHRSTAILTSSLFNFGYILRKGTVAKAINIIITKEWLANYLGMASKDEVLTKYLAMKVASLNFEPLDAEYRRLMNEALSEVQQPGPLKVMVIQNRIMMLVERFFRRLYKKIKAPATKSTFNNNDVQRLMHIEALLIKDFSKPPPVIAELAKAARMSETKLKTLFRKIYGSSLYEYYQKNRMFKARYLLLTQKYSIKEVGSYLGFQNLSNFSVAYKKAFGVLPSEV